jgi:hypothetical protein
MLRSLERWSASNSTSRQPSDLAQVNATIINMKTLTLGATNVFSPTMANKFRFNVTGNDYKSSRTLDHFGAATPPRRLRHSGSTAR